MKNNIARVELLTKPEFTIHLENSVLASTQKIVFLAFVIESVTITITLTDETKKHFYTFAKILF